MSGMIPSSPRIALAMARGALSYLARDVYRRHDDRSQRALHEPPEAALEFPASHFVNPC